MSKKYQRKTHYKMYKAGKVWMFAGVTALTLLAGGFADNHTTAHADSHGDDSSDNDATTSASSAADSATVAVSTQADSQGSSSLPTSVHNTAANMTLTPSTSVPTSVANVSASSQDDLSAQSSAQMADSPSLSYRIVDDSTETPVSSFESDGVEYDVDSAGTSYLPQDSAVMASLSADNDSINYNNDDSDADDGLFDGTDYNGDTYTQMISQYQSSMDAAGNSEMSSDIAAIFAPQSSSDSVNASLATTFSQTYQSYHAQNQSNTMTIIQLKQLASQASAYSATVNSSAVNDVTSKMSGVLASVSVQGDNLLTTSTALVSSSNAANSQSGQSFASFATDAISQANVSVSQASNFATSLNSDLQQFSQYVQSLADLQTADLNRQKSQVASLVATVTATVANNQTWLNTAKQAASAANTNANLANQQAQTWTDLASQHANNSAVASQKAMNDSQLASLATMTSQITSATALESTEAQIHQEASQATNAITQQINQLQLNGITPVSATLASQTFTSYQSQLATLNDNLTKQVTTLTSNAETLVTLAQQSDKLNTSLQALTLRMQQDANEDNDVNSLPSSATTSSATTPKESTASSSANTSSTTTSSNNTTTSSTSTEKSTTSANSTTTSSVVATSASASTSSTTTSSSSASTSSTTTSSSSASTSSTTTSNSSANTSSTTTSNSSANTSKTSSVDSHSAETQTTSSSAKTTTQSSASTLPTTGGTATTTSTTTSSAQTSSTSSKTSTTASSSSNSNTTSSTSTSTTTSSSSTTTSPTTSSTKTSTTSTSTSSSSAGSKNTNKTSTETTQTWYRITTAQTFVDKDGNKTALTPDKQPRVKVVGKVTKTANGYVYNVKYAGKIGTITLHHRSQLQPLYYTKAILNDTIGRHTNMYVYVKHNIKKYTSANFTSETAVKKYHKGQVIKVSAIIENGNKTYFKLAHGGYITSNRYFVSVAK